MTTWLSDPSANRHIKTYVKDFLDVSGNFSVRSIPTRTTLTSGGTNWQAKGQVLAGPDRNDGDIRFGNDIDMDASGNTFAVGAYGYQYSVFNGAVFVYAYDASAQVWYQKGNTIHSPEYNTDNGFGNSVTISSDGNIVFTSDPRRDTTRGGIYRYDYDSNNNSWVLRYNHLGWPNEYWGLNSARMSGNGMWWASSVYQGDGNAYAVKSYQWNTSTNTYDYKAKFYGSSLAINYDGTLILMFDTNANVYRVREWNGSGYNIKGGNIHIPNMGPSNSDTTAINDEGNIIAIAVPAHDMIVVLKYDSTSNSWPQHGSYLYGRPFGGTNTNPGQGSFRNSLRLNGAGDHIIFGSTSYRDAYVYKYDNDVNDWVIVPSATGGSLVNSRIALDAYVRAPEEDYNNDETFGVTCAISDDGTKIVVGAYNARIKYGYSGAAYAFELGESTAATTMDISDAEVPAIIDISNGIVEINNTNTITDYGFKGIRLRPSNTTYQQEYGLGVALNGDGNIMAIGAPHGTNLSNGNTKAGYVEVKQYSNGSWSALGSTIYGQWTEYYFGVRVALNNSGTRLLVAASAVSNLNKGAMEVYDWSGTSWVQVGSRIDGTSADNKFAWLGGIDINSTGDIIVGMSNHGGYVRAYQYVDANSDWVQLGSDITLSANSAAGSYGTRVALNDDGTILAVGDPRNDVLGPDDGLVKVYKFTNGSWNQFGGDIGTIAFGTTHEFGINVSLSADGYTLFTSSPWYQSNAGEGRAYIYSGDADKWVELGPPINPGTMYNEYAYLQGDASHISKDGTTVVMNESHNDTGGTDRGAMMMFKYTEGYWKQIATAYYSDYGAPNTSYPGYYAGNVRMNKDGTRIIVGAPLDDEGATNVGSVYVLDLVSNIIEVDPVLKIDTTNLNNRTTLPFDVTTQTITHSNGTLTNATYLRTKDENTYIYIVPDDGTDIPVDQGGINMVLGGRRARIGHGGALFTYSNGTAWNTGSVAVWHYNSGVQYAHGAGNQVASIMIDGNIMANGAAFASISWYSDRRIKYDIQSINDVSALEKLRLLNPCRYEYIDKAKRGLDIVDGFIAQEVKEILPYAVQITEKEIPNIYKKGIYSIDASGNQIITILGDYDTADLAVDASGNIYNKLQTYDKEDNPIGNIIITKVISSTTLQIESTATIPEEIFVYGQFVSDFHYLDKAKIFTVATAAMQEVDRQLQEDKAKTDTLESRVADLLARVTALENK